MQCSQDLKQTTDVLMIVVVQDDGMYKLMCSRGHTTVTALQHQNFEVLFDIGANAILDGYYREAVSSFSASLERFYEFYIKVVCLKRGLTDKQFSDAWSHIEAQSERQLGSFIFLYLFEKLKPPSLLTNKEREFRNGVIHKGIIPTRDEAIKYGERVLQIILPVLREMKKNYPEQVISTVRAHLAQIYKRVPQGTAMSTMVISTIVDLSRAEEEKDETLSEALTRFQRMRYIQK